MKSKPFSGKAEREKFALTIVESPNGLETLEEINTFFEKLVESARSMRTHAGDKMLEDIQGSGEGANHMTLDSDLLTYQFFTECLNRFYYDWNLILKDVASGTDSRRAMAKRMKNLWENLSSQGAHSYFKSKVYLEILEHYTYFGQKDFNQLFYPQNARRFLESLEKKYWSGRPE